MLDRAIADRRQLNTMTLPDFSDPETGGPHLITVRPPTQRERERETGSQIDAPTRQGQGGATADVGLVFHYSGISGRFLHSTGNKRALPITPSPLQLQ